MDVTSQVISGDGSSAGTTAQALSGTGATAQTGDASNGTLTSAAAASLAAQPVPGAQTDAATGTVSASQDASVKTPIVPPATAAGETSLVDRITLDETRESDADNRLTVLETNVKALGESLNGLTDAFNAYTAKAGLNTGDASAVTSRMDRLAARIFGPGSGL